MDASLALEVHAALVEGARQVHRRVDAQQGLVGDVRIERLVRGPVGAEDLEEVQRSVLGAALGDGVAHGSRSLRGACGLRQEPAQS